MKPAFPRLVVFGEALTDFVRTGIDAWRSAAGGACWNVARVVSTLGIPTGWAGAVSDDLFGREIIEKSRSAGLDMRFLQAVQKPPLIAMVHSIHPPKYFFLGEGTADLAFDAQLLPSGWEEHCEIAHFGCISLVRQPLGERLVEIAAQLKRMGKKISFDPNYRSIMGDGYAPLFERMLALADIVKASDEDIRNIYPGMAPDAALQRVRGLTSHATLLFTAGAQGAELFSPNVVLKQPAYPVNVQDTVGAGDACIGGYLASLLKDPDKGLQHHLKVAVATAAAACTQAGAHAPGSEEVRFVLGRE